MDANISQIFTAVKRSDETLKQFRDEWERMTPGDKAWYKGEVGKTLPIFSPPKAQPVPTAV